MRRLGPVVCLAGLSFALVAIGLSAQQAVRRAAGLAALTTFPGFYHQRPIVTVGTVSLSPNGQLRVGDGERSLIVISSAGTPEGPAEVRGQFWDLGRMNADDPRLGQYNLGRVFQIDPEGPWPRPGQVLAIVDASVVPATPPTDPSIRALVLFPSRFRDQRVTVTGQFGGRNLLGDLPDAPANSRWDFVVRAADAAVWVSDLRPRGRDFELSLDARVDTGRWVEVTGTLQDGRGLQWIDGEVDSLKIVPPPAETPLAEPIRVPLGPPPEVVFSTPVEGETEVDTTTNVRIQFSRDIDPASIASRVRVSYVGTTEAVAAEVDTQYRAANRVLEITFSEPLVPFRRVKIELVEGIVGSDKQALQPWVLEFETGR